MQSLRVNRMVFIMVAAAAMIFATGVAQANYTGVIKPNTLGAAIVLPYLTSPLAEGGERVTVVTLTNASDEFPVELKVEFIGRDFSGDDFRCPLTPEETTYFIVRSEWLPPDQGGDRTTVTYECSSDIGSIGQGEGGGNAVVTQPLTSMDGIVFASLECWSRFGDLYGPECGEVKPDGFGAPTQHKTMTDNILTGD